MRKVSFSSLFAVILAACSSGPTRQAESKTSPVAHRLGIRPSGDTAIQPDLSKIRSGELKKVYGMAGAEKSIATIVYNYAGKNGPPVLSSKADSK
jgi:hypothetical protein